MSNEKYQKLKEVLTGMGSVLVAFSGGTDSSLVLKVAHDMLGDKAVAMTAVSASLPASERLEAVQVARQIGAQHILVEFRRNSGSRLPGRTHPTAVSSARRKPTAS